jgi:hypothetical protein
MLTTSSPGSAESERLGGGRRLATRANYFYALSAGAVVLIDIYSKAQKEDLNAEDKKWLRRALEEIKGKL